MSNLTIIALDNSKEMGLEVNKELNKLRKTDRNYILDIIANRFSNGEGKVKIEESIREKDIYLLADIGNYGITYNIHGFVQHMSPDEHFQDIKRTISAICGYSEKITLIMPLLYQSRQHKRKGRESADCAIALQELANLGVDHIITFDAHDPTISNSIPNLPFENLYPTHTIIKELLTKEELKNTLIISPDMGATERARYFAEVLHTNVGAFYKRRDLTKVVDGKNPIIEHTYMGPPVQGCDVLIVDDMIASGTSMLEVGKRLKQERARKVYFIATFSLFTEGIETFERAHQKNYFDRLYTTNLSYIPKEYKERDWLYTVNCSKNIAEIINMLHEEKTSTIS